MCGRYTLAAPPTALVEAFDVPLPDFDWPPCYNVSPGGLVPVVAEDRRGRRLGLLEWGLVPHWKDEPGKPLINARSESVTDKPSFAEAFERRRCLVPADGFYEWRRDGERRLPFWFHSAEGELLAFAAIWERWSRPGAEPRHTFAILTTDANPDVAPVHDRMPVLVGPGDRSRWLDRKTRTAAAAGLLRPAPAGALLRRRVSTRVNRTAEDDAGLIEPVDE